MEFDSNHTEAVNLPLETSRKQSKMPRPSITMVFHRTSRSSRITTTQDSDQLTESVSDPQSSPPPSDSSVEKRIRKPSQRMLEALQDDTEVSSDRTATNSVGKRRQSPSSSTTNFSVPRSSKRNRVTKNETDVTPEAVLDAGEFTTPDKSPRKRMKRGSEASSTIESNNVAFSSQFSSSPFSSSSKKSNKNSATRKSQPRSRTRSQLSDPSEALPSTSATEAMEEETMEEEAMEEEATETIEKSSIHEEISTQNKNSKTKTKHGSSKTPKSPKIPKGKAISKRKSSPADESEAMPSSVKTTDSSSIADEGNSSLTEATSLTNDRRLTARQRAKLFGAEEHLIKLEDPRAKTPPADYLERKEERNKKRREQAAERREELKTETVQKLLHKAPVVKKGTKIEENSAKKSVKFLMNKFGTSILYPDGAATMQAMLPINLPSFVKCGVTGCKNAKKYSCSKTNIPLCSLNCYKKLQSRAGNVRAK